jgi:hypothetical protein
MKPEIWILTQRPSYNRNYGQAGFDVLINLLINLIVVYIKDDSGFRIWRVKFYDLTSASC